MKQHILNKRSNMYLYLSSIYLLLCPDHIVPPKTKYSMPVPFPRALLCDGLKACLLSLTFHFKIVVIAMICSSPVQFISWVASYNLPFLSELATSTVSSTQDRKAVSVKCVVAKQDPNSGIIWQCRSTMMTVGILTWMWEILENGTARWRVPGNR